MNVEIRFRTLDPSNALREHASDVARRRLDRFRHKVESVGVRVVDVNGPRGGLDKVCQVSVHGVLGTTALREQGSDAYVVVARAIERLAAALGRQDARRRSHAPSPTTRRSLATRRSA